MSKLDGVARVHPFGHNGKCLVYVTDGEDKTAWNVSGVLTVQNTPPTTPEIQLDSSRVSDGESLTCSLVAGSTDVDGDSLAYTWQWLVDGVVASSGDAQTFDTSGLSGSIVSCTSQSNDGEAGSDWAVEASAQITD